MRRERTNGARSVWALSCAVLASAPLTRAQQHHPVITDYPQVEVKGTLRMDSAPKPVTGATVSVETSDGVVVEDQSVSNNAQFDFNDLHSGSYVVVATADGYEPFQQTVDLTHNVNVVFVDIILKPAGSAAEPAGNLPSRSETFAPKKARKEREQGARSLAGGKLDDAQAHFEKAVGAYPCYARAQTDLAVTLMREGQSPRAEAPLKKSIECDPDYVDAYLHLGRLLNEAQRYPEGRRVLAEGVRRAPSSWDFYFQLGESDFGLKDYSEAEQDYGRAQSFGLAVPAVIHERLAAVYLKESAYGKAYAEMQAYLAQAPWGRYAAGIRTLMQQLQSAGLVHPPPAAPPPARTQE